MSEENKNKDLDDKTNNEILFEVKQMEADYEALKLKMLKDFDELVEIENRFNYANVLLLKRLKKD
jgi:hypothetical protein